MEQIDQHRSTLINSLEDAERRVRSSEGKLRIHYQLVGAAYAAIQKNSDALDKIQEATNAVESYQDGAYRRRLYHFHKARLTFIHGLYQWQNNDLSHSAAYFQKARQMIAEMNDDVCDAFDVTELYIHFGKFLCLAGNRILAIEYLTHALLLVSAPDIDVQVPAPRISKVYLPFPEGYHTLVLGRVHLLLGRIYATRAEEELALRHLYAASACFEKIESFVYLCYTQSETAHVYLGIGKHESAQTMLEQARESAYRSGHIDAILDVKDTGVRVMLACKRYDQAEQYCSQLIEECLKQNIGVRLRGAYKFQGDIYFAQKQYDEACSMYLLSVAEFERGPLFGPREGPLIGLSKVHAIMGNYHEAIRYGELALKISQNIGDMRNEYGCHEVLSQAYKALGCIDQALEHQELHHGVKARALSLEKGERIAAVDFNRKLQEAQIEARRQVILREYAEKRLQERERELSQLTLSLEHKNALLAKRNGADNGHSSSTDTDRSHNDKPSPYVIIESKRDSLDSFKDRVETLYPEFCRKLSQAEPGLTVTEVRVCALTKAQLSVKETAHTLCVSESAILKTRWRIRRKLGLQRSRSLVAFLNAM